MDSNERHHQHGVEWLVSRLSQKNYDMILMNPTYKVGELVGELDVLAFRGTQLHYYEVKSHQTHSARCKAKKQIHRVQEAFPNSNVRGIYVPLDGYMERMK